MNDPAQEKKNPLRVLLVEDDWATMKALTRYLERRGYWVIQATCVSEAINALQTTSFDVLLSDLGLPDGFGWDIPQRVRLPPSLQAIAISGYGHVRDVDQSKAAGFHHHLTKPFNLQSLTELLKEVEAQRSAS